MAEPITAIEHTKIEENLEIVRSVLGEKRNESAIEAFSRFNLALESSGILPMLSSLLEHYNEVLKIFVEQVSTQQTSQFINNLLTIYTLLSSIDQRKLLSIMNNISQTINAADKFKEQDSLGLLSMLRLLRDPDVSAGMRAAFDIIGGLSRNK